MTMVIGLNKYRVQDVLSCTHNIKSSTCCDENLDIFINKMKMANNGITVVVDVLTNLVDFVLPKWSVKHLGCAECEYSGRGCMPS